MMTGMRTTIDIPSGVHQRLRAYAQMRGESMSATAAELLAQGLAPIDTPTTLHRSPITGLMVIDSGRPVTSEEVADLIDEDE